MPSITKTGHLHIVKRKSICGARPIICGTRIPVKAIVGYYKLGMTVEEILEGYPPLTPAQVYDALSYYHDHQEEIEKDIQNDGLENILNTYNLVKKPSGELVSKNRIGG